MQPLGRNFWIEQTAKQPAHSAANQIGNRGGDIQCPILQIDKQGDSAERENHADGGGKDSPFLQMTPPRKQWDQDHTTACTEETVGNTSQCTGTCKANPGRLLLQKIPPWPIVGLGGVFYTCSSSAWTTKPANMSPAQEGTQETEAGILRRPGGGVSSAMGVAGGSALKVPYDARCRGCAVLCA